VCQNFPNANGFQTDWAIQRSDAFEMGTKVKDSLRAKLYPQQ
jgi:hypothetical protein